MTDEHLFHRFLEFYLGLDQFAKRNGHSFHSLCLLPPLYESWDRGIEKTVLFRVLPEIASAHTAGKYVAELLEKRLAIERENETDRRSRLVLITEEGAELYESVNHRLTDCTRPLDWYYRKS